MKVIDFITSMVGSRGKDFQGRGKPIFHLLGPFHSIFFVSDRTFTGFFCSYNLFGAIIDEFELVKSKYYRTTLYGEKIKSLELFFPFQNEAGKSVSDRTKSEVVFFGM